MENLLRRLEELDEARKPFVESLTSLEGNAFADAFCDLAVDLQAQSEILADLIRAISGRLGS